jgi:serine/threonine-protein kinase
LLSEATSAPGRADESGDVIVGSRHDPGDVIIGKYQLEHVLGQGGMGVVWRARNLALDSPVAIKVMGSVLADRNVLCERLLLEARAAATVVHPAIVRVFDVDQTERGEPFIVMEFLPGPSLGTVLATEGRMSAARAVSMLLPIAEALKVANDHGVVHRDVKPDNILIVEDNGATQPKLVDFGIVKVRRDGVSKITEAGQIVGSPSYSSPEQARGQEDVDHRTDVWGFSVSLYEAIAARPPFDGANYNALLRQILEDSPTSLRDLELVDDELSRIVARGLSKQPEQRGTIGEMGQALATWLLKQGITQDICGTALTNRWLHGPHELRDGETARPRDARERESRSVRRFGVWLALLIVLALGTLWQAFHSITRTAAPSAAPATNEEHSPHTGDDKRTGQTGYQDIVLAPLLHETEVENGSSLATKPTRASPPVSAPGRPSTANPSAKRSKPQDLMNPY